MTRRLATSREEKTNSLAETDSTLTIVKTLYCILC